MNPRFPQFLLLLGLLHLCRGGVYVPCHDSNSSPTFLCIYDNRCIPESKKCDGISDCKDKTDEDHCEHVTCSGRDWFKCKDGSCITSNFVCDGEFDCLDKSDEDGECLVKNHICPENNFACKDGLCIPQRWVCDSTSDCLDNSDEAPELCNLSPQGNVTSPQSDNNNVAPISTKHCKGFQCKSGECILNRWVCDGAMDCADGSDEGDTCEEKSLSAIDCESSPKQFHCKGTNECIPTSKVCNNHPDCSNGYDEASFCSEQRSNCSSLNCDHTCTKHPDNGPTCECNPGYELHDGSKCLDVNECREFGICSQLCYNTLGSYVCSCKEGYRSLSGSCSPIEDDPILIFSTKNEVRVKNLNNKRYSLTASNIDHLKIGDSSHAVGVSYDPLESRVYWSEFESDKEKIVSADIYGKDKRNVITSGLSVPEDIAVDHLGRNLYFTDGGRKHIVVCILSGAYCSVLIEDGVDKPRAIALHHTKGLMFYSDWGSKPMIVKAGMDGSQVTPIITEEIKWANGVAVDVVLDRLFWTDAKFSWIESAKFDGSDRQRVLEDHIIHPFSVAVFGDFVYWSDWQDKVIQSCNKFNGKSHQYLVKENELVTLGIHISHPLIEKYDHNPCSPKKCSHICLLTPSAGFACGCPENMVLGEDRRTCVSNTDYDEFALVLSDGNTLSIMRPHNLGRTVDEQLSFRGISQISTLTYNPVDHFLYIGSKATRMIYEVDFLKRTAKEIATGYPNDLAYDSFADNLYWTDGDTNSIQVKDISSGASTILVSNLNHPVAIDILQNKKLLVFTETKGNPSVKVSSLRGTNIIELPNLERFIKHPMGIAVHDEVKKKSTGTIILIMDSYKNHIIKYDFDQRQPTILQSKLASPTSILSVGERVLWTEIHRLTLFWKKEDDVKYKSLESIVTHSHPFLRLASVLPSKTLPKLDNFSAPCRTNNGGCSDLCFSGEFSTSICMCPEGKIPLPNNTTQCYSECSDTLFHCGNGVCIPHRWKCDGIPECSNGKDEEDCVRSTTCEGSSFQCPHSKECVPSKWVCDGSKDCEDGSDEHQCNVIDCGNQKTLCDDRSSCVLDIWRCDGYPDCPDGSDELRCISADSVSFPRTSNELDSDRVQKDVDELIEMRKDLEDLEGSSRVEAVNNSKESTNVMLLCSIGVLILIPIIIAIGFLIHRWDQCSNKASELLRRLRNPYLDKTMSFQKGKNNRLKEMSVMGSSGLGVDNCSHNNQYSNRLADKPDTTSHHISRDIISGGGMSINMEDDKTYPGDIDEDDDDFMMYNGVASSYDVDDDKATLL